MSESSKTPLISLSFPTSATSSVQVAIWENRVNVSSGSTDRNRERPTGADHNAPSGSSNESGSHPHQEKNGEYFTTHSCTVQRRYRDGNEWKSTQSFRASDLLMISFAAQEAYRRLMEEKQKS